jgi:hypothetical protein
MARQHATLGVERWAAFSLDQQILMIGNEMNRAGKLIGDAPRFRGSCERVLNLTDLTIAVQKKPTLRRELLRWRDLAAALFVAPEPSRDDHERAFRCLLRFTPTAARQIPFVLGGG